MWVVFLLLTGLAGCSAIVFLVLTIMKKSKAWIGLIVSIGLGVFTGMAFLITAIMAVPSGTGGTTPVTSDVDETSYIEEDDVDTGEGEESESAERTVEVNEEYKYNDLTIVIDEIDITEKDIKIGMTLDNDSEASKSFHPDQHNILVGKKQLSANMFMTKGDVSGEIHPGIEKTGTIRFLIDEDDGIDTADITEIKLMLGKVYDSDTVGNSESFEEVINIE